MMITHLFVTILSVFFAGEVTGILFFMPNKGDIDSWKIKHKFTFLTIITFSFLIEIGTFLFLHGLFGVVVYLVTRAAIVTIGRYAVRTSHCMQQDYVETLFVIVILPAYFVTNIVKHVRSVVAHK